MVREIDLGKGITTLVDDADYEWLSSYRWFSWQVKKTSVFYAARTEYYVREDGRKAFISIKHSDTTLQRRAGTVSA
jgi:hypothetical protein